MFGQKPKLPVDRLLGSSDETVERTPLDWVTQHQEYLTSIYASARNQLEAVAERRRAVGPQSVSILPPGTLVYCRNNFQGRHKIQDVWSSTMYEVVTCSDEVGTLYKIKPWGMEGPIKVMHGTELKPLPHSMDQADLAARINSTTSLGPGVNRILRTPIWKANLKSQWSILEGGRELKTQVLAIRSGVRV